MTRPYSNDLRERVVAIAENSPNREAGSLLGVSAASVSRWYNRKRETGSVAPAKMGGYRKPILLSEHEWLVARLEGEPDLTLRALLAELHDRGVEVSYGALWNYLEREGFSFKKKPCSPASRIGRRLPGGELSGASTRAVSTLSAWSSSTRPGRRQT